MIPYHKDISSYGYMVDDLIFTINGIMIALLIISFGVIIYCLFAFRASKNPKATHKMGSVIGKLVYLDFVMIVLDLVMATMSVRGWTQIVMKDEKELLAENQEHVTVKVTARQFYWSFAYAGMDEKLQTNDDFTLGNNLVVPQDTLVILKLTSGDVIHSFFSPNLRIKYDAVPGRETMIWFIAREAGDYEVACAELCGPEHYKMKSKLKVLPKPEYKKWLNERYTEIKQ